MPLALIAGGGIGGLATALALRRAGWEVRVYERASSPHELGFDLMLTPNAVAALGELGIADAVASAGVTIDSVAVKARPTSRLRRVDLGPVPPPLRSIIASRRALHGALLEAVGPGTVVFGAEAAGCRISNGRAVLELAGGRRETGDVLVGAEGIGSAIRRALRPGAQVRPRGLVGLRGAARGVHALLPASLTISFAPGADSGLIDGGGGIVYWFVSARDTRLQCAADETRRLADGYAAIFGEPLRTVLRATSDGDLRFDVLADADPIQPWGEGPITLLGDAAHPMLPHAGQGAAQALEDAVALGLALRECDDPASALRRYEMVRARRTARVVRLARRLSWVRTNPSATVGWLRAAGVCLMPPVIVHLAKLLRPGDPHATLRHRD